MSTSTILQQSEFAKRQLERMGWKEGNGLGKDRQGRATPIIVSKRSDETGGLGIEKEKVRKVQETLQDEWWKDALGDTLSKLSSNRNKDKKKKKKRKRDDNDQLDNEIQKSTTKKVYTDEELFIATGGARFGMRAGKTRNQAKWRRVEMQERQVEQQQKSQDSHEQLDEPLMDITINKTSDVVVEETNQETKSSATNSKAKKEKKKRLKDDTKKQDEPIMESSKEKEKKKKDKKKMESDLKGSPIDKHHEETSENIRQTDLQIKKEKKKKTKKTAK